MVVAISCYGGIELHHIPALQLFTASSNSLLSVTTILLNSVVLLAIWKTSTTSLNKPTKALLASLALTDLLYGMTVMPLTITLNMLILSEAETQLVCVVWRLAVLLALWLSGVSLYSLTLISIDRFLAIKLMNAYRHVVTTKRCVKALVAGWLGLACILTVLFVSKNLVIEDVDAFSQVIRILIIIFLVLFLLMTTISYGLAFSYLKKFSANVTPEMTKKPDPSRKFYALKYRRSFNTMLIILLVMILFYLPYAFSLVMEKFNENGRTKQLIRVGQVVVAINCTCNPLLYLWRLKQLRQTLKSLVK